MKVEYLRRIYGSIENSSRDYRGNFFGFSDRLLGGGTNFGHAGRNDSRAFGGNITQIFLGGLGGQAPKPQI
jgi:hypothetical protein